VFFYCDQRNVTKAVKRHELESMHNKAATYGLPFWLLLVLKDLWEIMGLHDKWEGATVPPASSDSKPRALSLACSAQE